MGRLTRKFEEETTLRKKMATKWWRFMGPQSKIKKETGEKEVERVK